MLRRKILNAVSFVLTFFISMFFLRLELCDSSRTAGFLECGALRSKYKHSQRGVVNWSGYGAYYSFLSISEKKFVIPGLCESFVPQGLTFCESLNSFMISGYSDDGGAAYIISVDSNSGRINGEYKIIKRDGSVFSGHSGGIASYGRYIYITDGYILYYIPCANFVRGSAEVSIAGEIRLPASASFISTYDGYLWAGNFYHSSFADKYDVSVCDKYKRVYRTVIVGYRFDDRCVGALKSEYDGLAHIAVPYAALLAPDEVQGLAFTDSGSIHLSCSYGRNVMSRQLLYSYPPKKRCDTCISIGKKSVPAWFLNNDILKRAVTAPPMSEGTVCRDGKVYVIFESAAKKYRGTSLDPTDCVWEIKW